MAVPHAARGLPRSALQRRSGRGGAAPAAPAIPALPPRRQPFRGPCSEARAHALDQSACVALLGAAAAGITPPPACPCSARRRAPQISAREAQRLLPLSPTGRRWDEITQTPHFNLAAGAGPFPQAAASVFASENGKVLLLLVGEVLAQLQWGVDSVDLSYSALERLSITKPSLDQELASMRENGRFL